MRKLCCSLVLFVLASVGSGCHCTQGICDCDMDPDPCYMRAPWIQNVPAAPAQTMPLPAPEAAPLPKKI